MRTARGFVHCAGKPRSIRVFPSSPPASVDSRSRGWLAVGFEHIRGRHADYSPGNPDLLALAETVHRLQAVPCPEVVVMRVERRWEALAKDVSPMAGRPFYILTSTRTTCSLPQMAKFVWWTGRSRRGSRLGGDRSGCPVADPRGAQPCGGRVVGGAVPVMGGRRPGGDRPSRAAVGRAVGSVQRRPSHLARARLSCGRAEMGRPPPWLIIRCHTKVSRYALTPPVGGTTLPTWPAHTGA